MPRTTVTYSEETEQTLEEIQELIRERMPKKLEEKVSKAKVITIILHSWLDEFDENEEKIEELF